jgi:DNA-binding winged helix-turn-helix (wHTH) protein
MRRVWLDAVVEGSSLTRNLSVLRKVLGDQDERYIETRLKQALLLRSELPFPG